jgi:3-deoxy-D-manno-octulosonate 8-phosphate phosphatase KdsC-like HAD superfamily phosphatase
MFMGISLASKAGIIFALISGEDNVLIDRFAQKMKLPIYIRGQKTRLRN